MKNRWIFLCNDLTPPLIFYLVLWSDLWFKFLKAFNLVLLLRTALAPSYKVWAFEGVVSLPSAWAFPCRLPSLSPSHSDQHFLQYHFEGTRPAPQVAAQPQPGNPPDDGSSSGSSSGSSGSGSSSISSAHRDSDWSAACRQARLERSPMSSVWTNAQPWPRKKHSTHNRGKQKNITVSTSKI